MPGTGTATNLLNAAREGRPDAMDALFQHVYAELHHMSCGMWRNVPNGDTLQPTALVHEAYARMVDRSQDGWENRAHFFSVAARAMHDILVEQAIRGSRATWTITADQSDL